MVYEKALVLMSGGPDSFVAATWAKQRFHSVTGLFIDVGHSAAKKEREFFKRQIKYLGINKIDLRLSGFMDAFKNISPYAVSIFKGAGLELLPFSGGVAISLGLSVAMAEKASHLVVGLHQVDFDVAGYDLALIKAIGQAGCTGNNPVALHIPFQSLTKNDVFDMGIKENIPLEISWSCIGGFDVPCGQCIPCISRVRAFEGVVHQESFLGDFYGIIS